MVVDGCIECLCDDTGSALTRPPFVLGPQGPAACHWHALPLRKDTSKVTQVVRRDGESFEGLLRRFRKEVQEERVLSETRRRRFYEKPSQERKRKAAKKLRKSRRTNYKTEGSTR